MIGTVVLGVISAHARLSKSLERPTDNMAACDQNVQLAITRIKKSVKGPVHFFCDSGLVQQLWFSEASGLGAKWRQFAIENRDLFAPKDAKLGVPDWDTNTILRYWKNMEILNHRLFLDKSSEYGALGVTAGIISDFPDTRRLKLSTIPKASAATAKAAALAICKKERPGSGCAVKSSALGLMWEDGASPHLSWVVEVSLSLEPKEPRTGFICKVNADTGIPEPYGCSTFGYAL